MLRITWLMIGVLGAGGCAGGPELNRPNVVLLTLDTVRADVMGIYGAKIQVTPNFDALAQNGAIFERAYTVTPLTIPAHASILTGLYPPRHGVRDNGDFLLSEDANTLAERLRASGYQTVASVGAEVTSHHWGFAQGFDAFYDDMNPSGQHMENRWSVERPIDAVFSDFNTWSPSEPEAPWFAWLHVFDAHHPYEPPSPFDERYADNPYVGELAAMDAALGRQLKRMESDNRLDNTWFVIVADHGEGLGEHGESTHGTLLYNSTMRVPLLIIPPGSGAPTRVRQPVSVVDLVPTILDIAGVTSADAFDGRSLVPLMTRSASDWEPRSIYMESLYANRHYGWAEQRGLATPQWKFIHSTTPELYASDDFNELRNRSAVLEHDVVRLSGEIDRWREQLTPVGVSKDVESNSVLAAQLEALGYVSMPTTTQSTTGALPDPVKKMNVIGEVARLRGLERMNEEDMNALRALMEQEPSLLELRLILANQLAKSNQLPEAIQVVEQSGRVGELALLDTLLAHFLLADGQVNEALVLLEQVLERDPHYSKAHVLRLNAFLLSGQNKTFAEVAEQVLVTLPDDPVVECLAGVGAWINGSVKLAESRVKSALARFPNQPHGRLVLGRIALMRGVREEAERHLSEEVARFAPALGARRELVKLYAGQQRYEDQVKQLHAIIGAERANHLTSHSLAQALFNSEQYESALAEVRRCMALSPTYPHCALLHANVLNKLGQKKPAQREFERAKALMNQQR